MHLAVNAIPLTEGGGVTGLLGYLRAFQQYDPSLRITAFASRTNTLAALKTGGFEAVPCGKGRSFATRAISQTLLLSNAMKSRRCDLVLTTNSAIPFCSIPQVVHHRNVWSFESPFDRSTPEAGKLKLMLLRRAAKQAVHRATANVFISAYLRSAAEKLFPHTKAKNHVIYNGLNEALATDAARGLGEWASDPVICCVSYANQQKDNETAVRALAELIRISPVVPWRVEFSGGGNWERIHELARSLGVHDRVRFTGYLSRPDILALYRRSLCLLFTSYFESFGNPPLEAMSQGCPVVASNATAIPEVVGDSGILVQPKDHVAFAKAIQHLWDDKPSREALVAKGHRRAQNFTWATSAKAFVGLFESLIHAARK